MSIEAFQLVKEKMEVYANLRIEKHGADNVNGWDIKLSGSFANNAILPKLDAELLPALYTDEKQREFDEFKKKLRFPRAMKKALPWDWEIPRVVVTLHDEHDDGEDLIVSDCTAHKFTFLPKELGIIELDMMIKTKDLTEDQVMKLLRANGQELKISLECRPAEEKKDNFEQADLITQEPMSEARAKAEAEFKAGSAPAGDDVVGLPTLETSAPPDDVVDADFDPTQPEKQPEEAAIIPLKTRARRGSGKAVVAPE